MNPQRFFDLRRILSSVCFKIVIVVVLLLMAISITFPTLSVQATEISPWMDPKLMPGQRANLLLSAMTLDEKIAMVHGDWSSPYVGLVPANARLGIPALILQDGPAGVAGGIFRNVTAFPVPLTVAASWDPDLIQQYCAAIAAEVRSLGANVLLAPMMNIDRVPQAGRNWEGYGEDPYLAAQMAAACVRGIQSQGVIAVAKHFIDNDQEFQRATISSDIDDRTQHEIYLLPFIESVEAGVGAIMCAYNRINGIYACENALTLNSLMKGELGYAGWMISDWGATQSTVTAAINGLDMEMPAGLYFGDMLKAAVQSGQVPQSRLDDMVRRILTVMFQVGLFDRAPSGSPEANAQSPEHTQFAGDAAAQGIVLLKNTLNALPLSTTRGYKIAVIGSAAHTNPISVGGGSARVNLPYIVTPYQGIINRTLGSSITVRYVEGDNTPEPIPAGVLMSPTGKPGLMGEYFNNDTLSGEAAIDRVDADIHFDWGKDRSPIPGTVSATNWSARWKGTLIPPTSGTYALALTSDDGSRLFINGSKVIDIWGDHGEQTGWVSMQLNAGQHYPIEVDYYQATGDSSVQLSWITPQGFSDAISAASQADVAIVVVGLSSSEGSDRTDLSLPDAQDALISAVAQANPHTIVVVHTPAQVLMPWAEQVAAILVGWLPGQESGNALADVLFGDINPSSKLPMTFALHATDYPADTLQQYPGTNGHVIYSEGLSVGYRYFDKQNIKPLFPFGHGLSYTTFRYSNLQVSPATIPTTGAVKVTMDLKNTGSLIGSEVVQLYLGFPSEASEPPRQLKGFHKVSLRPGQTQRVTFTISSQEFSFWSAGLRRWSAYPGSYHIMVGASSSDIRLTGSFQVKGGILAGKVYQMETAMLTGGAKVNTDHDGYTGSGFVDGYWNAGATATFKVNVSRAGQYNVTVRYANSLGLGGQNTSQTLSVYLNGVKVRRLILPALANWEMWDFETERLTLNAGSNTIAYKYDLCDSGNVNLDAIIVESGEAVNLAINKPVMTSSSASLSLRPSNSVDGNTTTRWASAYSDEQWIQVDLGAIYNIERVVLKWDKAYGKGYELQVSGDGVNWMAISSITTGDGGRDTLKVSGVGRYVRMYGMRPGTKWGYSLWEFEVYGTPAENLALCTVATASSGESPDLTPNNAVDGFINTRWSSTFTDPQWIQVDLGAIYNIGLVVLNWERAYGKTYQLQVSDDAINWTTISSTAAGEGDMDGLYVSANSRYVRMNGIERFYDTWGYSLWEIEIYGTPAITQN